MVNQQYQQQKQSVLGFSKKAVKRAGDAIRKGCSGDERREAIEIIRNFRGSHLYPLMLIKNHVNRIASKSCDDFILARRLKRLPTILDKLERPTLDGQSSNAIQLTRMQDIGGCRIIFDTVEQVYDCLQRLKASRSVHKIIKVEDRMATPKASGYRGVHVVFSCYENGPNQSRDWYKHKIELQIRTKLQHAWATCVETMDIFAKTRLKIRLEGSVEYREFFKLSADLMAETEHPGYLSSEQTFKTLQRFCQLESELDILTKLTHFSIVTKVVGYDGQDNKLDGQMLIWFSQNEDGQMLVSRRYFAKAKDAEAVKVYNQLEEQSEIDLVVLIAVKQVADVKRAYPNYYADSDRFVSFMLNQQKRLIAELTTRFVALTSE